MSASRRLTPQVQAAIAALVVVIIVVVAIAIYVKRDDAFALFRSTHEASAESIGQGVTVTGDKVPDELKATIDAKTTVFPSTAESRKVIKPMTKLLDIGPSGSLKAPMTISFTLSRKITKADAITVIHNPTHKPDGWQSVPFQVAADGKHVLVVVTHLSLFQVFNTIIAKVLSLVTEGLVDTVTSGAFSEAKKPKCSDKATAESDGYSIEATYKSADTLFYCFDYESKTKDRIVRVTNNRRYPLEIKSSKMVLLDANVQSMSFIEVYRQNGHAIIMPRETLTFQVNPLKRDEKASINLSLSNWALGLGTLDTVYGVLLALVSKGKFAKASDIANAGLLSQDCLKNFDGESFKVGKVIVSCFGEALLKQAFGVVGLLLAPAILAFGIANNTRALANAFADRTKDRDKYVVAVSRTNQFADFVGKWRHEGGMLQVNADGSGKRVSALDAGAAGACGYRLMMMKGGGYCQIYESIVLKSINGNTAIGQYTKVYVTKPSKRRSDLTEPYHEFIRDNEGDLVHDDELEQSLPKPGDTFTLRLNEGDRWIEWKKTGYDGIGFKLCDVDSMSYRDVYVCDL